MTFFQGLLTIFAASIGLQQSINPPIEILKFKTVQIQDQVTLDKARKIEATNLYKQAKNLYKDGKYQRAIAIYQDSLIIWQSLNQKDMIGNSLNAIGSSYYQLDNYEIAISFYESALKLYQEIKDSGSEAKMLYAIAASYSELGQTFKAISIYPKAYQVFEKLGDRLNQAKVLINAGIDYRKVGQYSQALQQYQKAQPLLNEITNKNEISILNNGLGSVYSLLGQYDNASNFYQKAIDIISKDDSFQSLRNRAIYINNLGYVFTLQKKYDLALESFQRSLSISKKIDRIPDQGIALSNIGFVNIQTGKNVTAINNLNLALRIIREYKDKDFEARILDSLGDAYKQLGKYSEALNFYRDGLVVAKESGDRTTEAVILSNLGDLFAKQGNGAGAIAFYKQSVKVIELIRQDLTSLPIEQQKSYVDTVSYTYRALADLLLSQGRISEAIAVLELLKVQELQNYTRDDRRSVTDANGVTFLDKEQEILKKFDGLVNFRQRYLECERTNCPDLAKFKNERETLATQFTQSLANLKTYIKNRIIKEESVLDPEKVRNNKSIRDLLIKEEGAILIYPLVVENRIWITLAIASDDVVIVSTRYKEIDRKELTNLITQYLELLKDPNSDLATLKAKSKTLYEILLSPITKEIENKNIKHLIFSLDRIIRYVPMASLHNGNNYLVENYKISTILSADLTRVGQPLLGSEKLRILAGGLSNRVAGFNPLPNVVAELDEIVKEDQKNDIRGIFTGKQILNEEFTYAGIRDRLKGNNFLHIATHGKFVTGDRENSFLMMGDGTKLFLPSIQTLTDYIGDVQMVVLSACETALGGTDPDGIEIAGMGYYFLAGGVETVIASLWAVSDRSTSILMQRFYQNLAGVNGKKLQGRAEALQQAQLSLLRSESEAETSKNKSGQIVIEPRPRANAQTRSKTNFAHPYYWAAFILIGNGL
ncbi:CHAT domain-containing protein [Pseudanabaena sp. ABRG5-3]|uniref:CHAT domain-containing protein n=1 Tax=Pseudanabaena sp. ABRG5-3 TaxID=685565 RepID=UPI000DC6F9B5|nr:CHAT domain-containing protein [Pseudanabaena sp. ABRG5-3]BBC26665.1 tetratricopeptide repeat domain protein [Pseudanabaena sp. ABRG5-3]